MNISNLLARAIAGAGLLLPLMVLAQADTTYRVQPGDTLGVIGQHLRPEPDIKLQAVIELLHATNPDAFTNGDINRLIVGSDLTIPTDEQWAALPRWHKPDTAPVVAAETHREKVEIVTEQKEAVTAKPVADALAVDVSRSSVESPVSAARSDTTEQAKVDRRRLDEVVREALRTHPDMLAAQNQYLSREQEVRQARSGYYPSVDVGLGVGHEEVRSPATQDEKVDMTRHEASLSAEQSLFEGFATRSEVRRQEARTDSAAYVRQATAEDLALRTAEVYLGVLRYAELLDLARRSLYEHQNIHDQMVLRQRSGVGSKADLDQITARLALAQSNVIVAQNNLRDAKSNFKRVTGFFLDEENLQKPEFRGQLPKDVEVAIDLAVQQHPTLLSANSDINAAEAQYEASESPFWPRLSLEVDKRWDEDIGGVKGEDESLIAALRMRYNLYNGGADSARRKQTAYLLEESKDVRNDTLRQVEESLRLSWAAYEGLSSQLEYLQLHVRAARDTRASYLKQFNIGKRTLLDLLNTENELVDAKRARVNAEYDLLFAKYRILNGMGSLLAEFGAEI